MRCGGIGGTISTCVSVCACVYSKYNISSSGHTYVTGVLLVQYLCFYDFLIACEEYSQMTCMFSFFEHF